MLFVLRGLHYRGLLRQTQGYYAKYKTAFLEKNDFDVLFLGSSRAEMHYDTEIFDSLSGRSSFNLSLAGATPKVAFAALKTYLSKSTAPKYLIYEVDYHSLKNESREVREFNNFFPFLHDEAFREAFSGIDGRMAHFYYDPYFSVPFIGLKNLSTGFHGWLGLSNRTDSLYHKGFFKEVLRPEINYIAMKRAYTYFNITERAYLDSIINTCKKNKTRLAMVSSPIFGGGKIDVANKPFIISQLNNIAAINHIQYFDLSSLPFCNNRNLFIDPYHLNYKGARVFTPYLSRVFNNKIAINTLK